MVSWQLYLYNGNLYIDKTMSLYWISPQQPNTVKCHYNTCHYNVNAWFPGVHHFENLTKWIQLSLGLYDHAWKATNGNSLSMTIFSKFWSQDRYRICIHGSRTRCSTGIANKWHQSCWHDVSRAALGLSFRKYKHKWKWPNLSIQLRRQCFINLWIQTALFLIIAKAATSAAVSWQFSGWISPIPFWLVISISTDYITALLTKYGVYNAVKYFSRNN